MKPYAKDDAQETKSEPRRTADAAKASATTAEDKAKRCTDARAALPEPDGRAAPVRARARTASAATSTATEIDAARANAKKVMDEFCAGQ